MKAEQIDRLSDMLPDPRNDRWRVTVEAEDLRAITLALRAVQAFAGEIAAEAALINAEVWPIDDAQQKAGEAAAYAHCALRLREIIGDVH